MSIHLAAMNRLQRTAGSLIRSPIRQPLILNAFRIHIVPSRQLRRAFHTSPIQLRRFAHDDGTQYAPPPPPPPKFSRNIPRILVGSIFGIWVVVFIYRNMLHMEASQGNQEALHTIRKLEPIFVHKATDLQNGKWYTYFTSAFVHNGLPHIAFNAITFWGFAPEAVLIARPLPFLGLYLGSILMGGLAQDYFWKRESDAGTRFGQSAVGASGGVFGVLSYLSCWLPKRKIMLLFVPMPFGASIILAAVGSVAAIQYGWQPGIGHADHLGGMAFGVLFFLLTKKTTGMRLGFRKP